MASQQPSQLKVTDISPQRLLLQLSSVVPVNLNLIQRMISVLTLNLITNQQTSKAVMNVLRLHIPLVIEIVTWMTLMKEARTLSKCSSADLAVNHSHQKYC